MRKNLQRRQRNKMPRETLQLFNFDIHKMLHLTTFVYLIPDYYEHENTCKESLKGILTA